MSKVIPHDDSGVHSDSTIDGRIILLDVAKGLAILLVVLGHLTGSEIKSIGNEWYEIANNYLYKFHMAFFFFICGLIYFHKFHLPASFSDYFVNIKKRFWRVAPAYFLFAIFSYCAKLLAQNFLAVDRKVDFSIAEVSKLVTYPTQSYASFLWFIFVLLLIESIAPLLFWISRGNKYFAVAIALVCFFVPTSKFFALHQITHYLLFFVIPALFVSRINDLFYVSEKLLPLWIILFAGSITFLPFSSLDFFLGIFGSFLLIGITRAVPHQFLGFFTLLGKYTFVIYLLNSRP